ncbi:MAG: ferritin-like domain-containing protein [Methylocella sp.]
MDAKETYDKNSTFAASMDRRSLVKGAGFAAAAAGAIAAGFPEPALAAVTDADILNFALNLEYLEAEFYLRATTGSGLPSGDTTGVGTHGTVVGGSEVPFESSKLTQFAQEIARDEEAHVLFLRAQLASLAVAEPQINLKKSFTTLARAAGIIGPTETFNPFETQRNFLLGAFIFEDVGVTAYRGAAPLLSNKAYLSAAAGILAVEAYHASEIRTLLYQRELFQPVQKISALRAKLSGANDDQGILLNGRANIVPADQNAIAFSRTTSQVLNIVYGGVNPNFGLFFPSGVNGTIHSVS